MAPVSLVGFGSHLPRRIVTNDELSRRVDTTDEWIRTRTGIAARHVVEKGQAASDLAAAAGRVALRQAGLDPAELELIVVATVTPDQPVPSTAAHVQRELGARNAVGFDLAAACTGYLYALFVASKLVASRALANALVVGVDVMSSIIDPLDRETCVLFGDGAGATLLAQGTHGGRIVDQVLGLDGSGSEMIQVPAGGSRMAITPDVLRRRDHCVRMRGREVFQHAVRRMTESVLRLLRQNDLTCEDVDLVVPHQANLRIIEAVASRLGVPMDRVVVDLEQCGNTSAAALPMALASARESDRIRPGDVVVLVGFGAGLSWGAALVRW